MIVLLLVAAALFTGAIVTWIAWEATHPPRRTAGWALAFGLPVDPAECGMTFESWWLERPGGVRLPVWDVALEGARELAAQGDSERASNRTSDRNSADAAGARGAAPEVATDRPTLVVVHGWGRSRIDSLARLRALLAIAPGRFRRALLIDLRGHGESEGAASVSRLGDGDDRDLLELLRRVGGDRCMVMGHSMGAVVAIAAAALASSEDHRAEVRSGVEKGLPPAVTVIGVIAVAPYVEVAVPMIARLRARELPARPFTELALVALRLVSGIRRRSTIDSAERACVPLAVVAATEDPLAPIEGAEAIAAAHVRSAECHAEGQQSSPPMLFLRLEGAGHAAGLDSLDDEGATALRAFIDDCIALPGPRARIPASGAA